jgi:hypothetical protein
LTPRPEIREQYRHFSDMPSQPDDVRSPGKSRHPAARPRLPFLTEAVIGAKSKATACLRPDQLKK